MDIKIFKKISLNYNNYIIYKIYIKSLKKLIQIKNLYIFKVYKIKTITKLFDYNISASTF